MPALNFKKQFVELIKTGTKRQTIRPLRIDGRNPHSGDMLYFYTGMRNKKCKKIGEAKCQYAGQIVIDSNLGINLNSDWVNNKQMMTIVRADGFTSWVDFLAFFQKLYELPFVGLLIKW